MKRENEQYAPVAAAGMSTDRVDTRHNHNQCVVTAIVMPKLLISAEKHTVHAFVYSAILINQSIETTAFSVNI